MTMTVQAYVLKHKGNVIFKGTESECWIKLQRVQGQSADYALKYGGYTIIKAKGLRIITK